jgi:hypothetical protein
MPLGVMPILTARAMKQPVSCLNPCICLMICIRTYGCTCSARVCHGSLWWKQPITCAMQGHVYYSETDSLERWYKPQWVMDKSYVPSRPASLKAIHVRPLRHSLFPTAQGNGSTLHREHTCHCLFEHEKPAQGGNVHICSPLSSGTYALACSARSEHDRFVARQMVLRGLL